MENETSAYVPRDSRAFIARVLTIVALLATCLWAYWPSFVEMADKWSRRPEYSHGWMVPLAGVFILWHRRDMLGEVKPRKLASVAWIMIPGVIAWLGPWMFEVEGSIWTAVQASGVFLSLVGFAALLAGWLDNTDVQPSWWGLAVLLLAVAVRLYAASHFLEWIDFVSLIPFVAGMVLLFGGKRIFRWSWVVIAFLFFMIPLPFTLEVALRDPLRAAGTFASTYAMQTLGLPAFAEGNVVTVNDVRIDIVEACSGLRMMMVFFALSVGLAIIIERPLWQRLLIACSAIPIALITNILRITFTGLLYVWGYDELADDFFHDFAGWVMPLMAVGLLRLELWYLDHLFIIDEKKPLDFGMRGSGPAVA